MLFCIKMFQRHTHKNNTSLRVFFKIFYYSALRYQKLVPSCDLNASRIRFINRLF